MTNLDEVLTFSEAAEKWGLADGKTIRKAVERNRFEPQEIKKSGNVWLTTYDAMVRVFGAPRSNPCIIYIFDLFHPEQKELFHKVYEQAKQAIEQGELVSIVESKEHPERIFCMIKTMEELEGMRERMKYTFK